MNTLIARDRFPLLAVGALAVVIVVAFTRTYYLRFLADLPPLSRAAHVHGILATAWLALHFTQARLVAARRVDIHRRLGMVGAVLGALLACQAFFLSIGRVATGHAPAGREPLQFLSVSMGTTLMFTVFFVGALALRKRKEWHKRLMLLATMALLVPATGRLDAWLMVPLGLPRGLIPLPLTAVFVAWGCIHDWRQRGRPHPAFVIGGGVLLMSIPLRAAVGYTDGWLPIAKWLVGTFA